MNRSRLLAPALKHLIAANLALLMASAFAQTPEEELARKVDQLADELAKVKGQLKEMREQRAATPTPIAPAPASAGAALASGPETAAATGPAEPATVLFSYGGTQLQSPDQGDREYAGRFAPIRAGLPASLR